MTGSGNGSRDVAPLVSIVVPAYNMSAYLEATLRSIQLQTETHWECVVVDDGSTDDTYQLALRVTAGDLRFTVLKQPNSGASAARNRGYRATCPKSSWISFMDSDDVWRPHALETLLANAQRPGTVGAHGLAELVDATGRPAAPGSYSERGRNRLALQGRSLRRLPLDRPTDFDVLINGNVLFPPGLVLASRSAYEQAGRFDEQLKGPEDWDMLIRLSRFGSLTFVNDILLDYRRHGSNLGAHPDVPRQAWLVRCLNFWSRENSPEQRQRARQGWRAYQRLLRTEQVRLVGQSLVRGQVRVGTTAAVRAGVYTLRGWRGFPLPRVTRSPLAW